MPRRVPIPSDTAVPSIPTPNRLIAAARGVFRTGQHSSNSNNLPADDVNLPSTPVNSTAQASTTRASTDPLLPHSAAERHRPSPGSLNEVRRSTIRMGSPPLAATDEPQHDEEDLPLTQPPEILNHSMPPPPPRPSRGPTVAALNAEYIPPDDSTYPSVPLNAKRAIEKMIQDVWGITEPRTYQVRAIFFLCFVKVRMMYLIRKTGEGKSLVLMGMATILRGVTVCLVPLLGLGSSQASNTQSKQHRIEGYHVDEYRDDDFTVLNERIAVFSLAERSSIILYISPQNLHPKSKWYKLLSSVASNGHLSALCVDEAHACVEQSDSFRPEFKTALDSMKALRSISTTHHLELERDIPMLVMSATFRIPEQKAFNVLIDDLPDIVMWGDMNRRNVGIFGSVVGEPLSHLVNAWAKDATADPDMQSLIMANSAKACDGRIIDRLEKVAKIVMAATAGDHDDDDNNNRIREFMSFTGDCGLMLKMFLMHCFCGHPSANLPIIWCMPCTAAAHCGVSSKKCRQCYRLGPCPNWYDLVQEAGRVDRLLNAPRGLQKYTMFLNVPTFLSLWVRTQAEQNSSVRKRICKQLFEVLKFVVTPSKCYHEAIEEHFENPATYESRGPCIDNCTYCLKLHRNFTGPISKQQLQAALQADIFSKGSVTASSLVGLLTDKIRKHKLRKAIWGKSVDSGKVHGLVLSMIATGMVELSLINSNLVGTDKVDMKHVMVGLGKVVMETQNGEQCYTLAVLDQSIWTKFNLDGSR